MFLFVAGIPGIITGFSFIRWRAVAGKVLKLHNNQIERGRRT